METKTRITEKIIEALGFEELISGSWRRRMVSVNGNEYSIELTYHNSTENWSLNIRRKGDFSGSVYRGYWDIDTLRGTLKMWGLAL